jgi:molybdopterin synthase catalytic subunit
MAVIVTPNDFDTGAELKRLSAGRYDTGAVVTFTGLCRGEAGALNSLTLECYEEMAINELQELEHQARARFSLDDVLIIHRYGAFKPGDNIMCVITLSAHRKDAFDAAEFLMDYLKTQAPFWKLAEGDNKREWVEAKAEDDEAVMRWANASPSRKPNS